MTDVPEAHAQHAESLPFPRTPSGSIAGRPIADSVYSPLPPQRHLPEDAPNILIVLIDDAGPGLPTTFRGEVTTTTLDRVVSQGVAYNRFHPLVRSWCSSLTGR